MAGNPTSRLSSAVRERGATAAALEHSLLVLPVLLTAWLMWRYASSHQLGVDFTHSFWRASQRVADGLSPYQINRPQILAQLSFPYPALMALVLAPFSLLPQAAGEATFVAVSLGASLVALRLLDVSDWRVYMVVLLWWPVINGWQTANLTLMLVCGIAAAWRVRDRPWAAGLLVGVMISIKPVVWPLGLWLLAPRRYRATAIAAGVGLGVNMIAWAVLGLDRLPAWLHLLSRQTTLLYREGYGLQALAAHLGLAHDVGTGLQLLATAAVALGCVILARRGLDRCAFTIAVVLMLVSSPLVDNHYLALLIVPLAIARPRLDRMWLVPLILFWLCPAVDAAGWQVALAWITVAGLTAGLVFPGMARFADPQLPVAPLAAP